MTLWDSYAINVQSYIENNPEEAPVVVILQFATYKPYDRVPGISNALNITKLIINEEIPDIVEFKKSFLQMIGSDTSSSSLLSPLSVRDPYFEEFVNETDFCNVGEVEDIETPKKVVICGSISSSNYNSWYYVACKICTGQLKEEHKVSHEGEIVAEKSMNQFRGKYKCPSKKCNEAIVDAVARYRVPFDVQDSTGSLAITLWEGQALPIFKITAMELLKKLVESGDDADIIPKEIEGIEDHIYALKNNIQQYNINNERSSYNILKLTKDPKIISELQEKHELTLEQPSYSNEESVEFPIENLSEKDSTNVVDDNVTSFVQSTSKTSVVNKDKKNTEASKRKFQVIYDVDNPPQQPITKAKRSSKAIVKNYGKNKLLTPKKEK
ncbi:replication protein A 70 kDa DNA-binding subunit C-like [Bidens hawaiensis]|uniref:replication protein A 70 kDa DNA-binding subunit C-like n=1 Tax=Bidens hawaiensis TaxID=980011 RepID=UPI00404AC564